MMASNFPLTSLSEAQRTQVLERFEIIRLALGDSLFQAQVACTHQMAPFKVKRLL